jgi:hypothetical protein
MANPSGSCGVEVALAVILLVGGGLMVGSIVRAWRRRGYADSILTMRVQLPRGKGIPNDRGFCDRVMRPRGVCVDRPRRRQQACRSTIRPGHYRVEVPDKWIGEGVPKGICCSQTQWVTKGFFLAAGLAWFAAGPHRPMRGASGHTIGESLARRFRRWIDRHYLTSAEEGSIIRRRGGSWA